MRVADEDDDNHDDDDDENSGDDDNDGNNDSDSNDDDDDDNDDDYDDDDDDEKSDFVFILPSRTGMRVSLSTKGLDRNKSKITAVSKKQPQMKYLQKCRGA